ncbi:zinc-binding dehydrogenase [Quadrisphaera sp. RL12-1S]|uniref:zinc-binding dehydrogenase n=2 Tax=Quadrisphaera TaxID=317661 RepID=UPI0016481E51|nr:zinc-binding dehydrogenase [Quadrisphaera sp. RL12-1S]MBC3760243.1 zinc-binding dehydrogenase [Quadrisphaera sp. RL12-1S]
MTTETMQAVVCHGPEDYRLEQVPRPSLPEGGALVRVEAVGICASDLKCYHGAAKFWGDEHRSPWAEKGRIPGHELVGEVVEITDEAAARWGVAVGDRVVSEQIVPDWDCRYCLRGAYHMCATHDMYGFKGYDGAMAEFIAFPAKALVHKISKDLPPAHAAFAEPLSCALHAVERADIQFEDVVVVAGCGPIGLGMIAGAKAKGAATVVALDAIASKLDLARAAGADVVLDITQDDIYAAVRDLTGGFGADVYLEGTGHPAAVKQGLNLLRKLGTYVEYGVFGSEASADWSIISDDKELDVRGAHLGPHTWPKAVQMIESGVLPLEDICTHQLPLSRFQEGLDLVGSGASSVKVSLIPDSSYTG